MGGSSRQPASPPACRPAGPPQDAWLRHAQVSHLFGNNERRFLGTVLELELATVSDMQLALPIMHDMVRGGPHHHLRRRCPLLRGTLAGAWRWAGAGQGLGWGWACCPALRRCARACTLGRLDRRTHGWAGGP
jgi:hypothetical protein